MRLSKQLIMNSYKKIYDRAKGLWKSIIESKSCTKSAPKSSNWEGCSDKNSKFFQIPWNQESQKDKI